MPFGLGLSGRMGGACASGTCLALKTKLCDLTLLPLRLCTTSSHDCTKGFVHRLGSVSVAITLGWNLAGIKERFGLRVAASDVQLENARSSCG
jgi:hypothetical protein